jgi:hypothetical protein
VLRAKWLKQVFGGIEQDRTIVEFLEASLPVYELGIELSRVFGSGSCRIMARKESDGAKTTSCVI